MREDLTPSIRPARPDDAPAIAAVHVASWREAYRDVVSPEYLGSLSEEDSAATWLDAIGRAGGSRRVVVAEIEGDVVGFASWGPSRDEDADRTTQEIYAIYLEPESWGHGVARELMRTVLGEVGDGSPVTLWVLAENARARHFYRRHGFTTDGVERMEQRGGDAYLEVRYRRG